ncbi:MAG: LCP family protein [Anaerolineaceae bacterium]
MPYSTPKKRKSVLPFVLILLLIAAVLVAVSALSLNKIREGEPGFISNLWGNEQATTDDPYLTSNPSALAIPPYVKTILFMGSDYTPESGYRTDVMLLAAFNTKTGKVNLMSFPRDLWVTIPGWMDQRLNTAQPYGGNQLLGDTLAYNFGFRPDHFALVNFDGFQNIIRELGGIDVEVTERMEDACGQGDADWCVVEPGIETMDEFYAMWYVRARKNSTDFDRTRRAQEVIQAMVRKALSPTRLLKLPDLIKVVEENVEMDFKLTDLWIYALPLSKYFQDDLITTYRLSYNEAAGFTTDGGAQVLAPNIPAIQEILKQVYWINQ